MWDMVAPQTQPPTSSSSSNVLYSMGGGLPMTSTLVTSTQQQQQFPTSSWGVELDSWHLPQQSAGSAVENKVGVGERRCIKIDLCEVGEGEVC